MKTLTLFHIFSVLLTGLVAGLFYGYQCSVNKGLGNLPDADYLKAFQSINRSIQNPVFFLSFFGSIILLAVTTLLNYKAGQTTTCYFLVAALIIYMIGVCGVTIFGNVPLNEQLDVFDITAASPEAIVNMRIAFESAWNSFHGIRTFFSILTFLLTIIGIRAI